MCGVGVDNGTRTGSLTDYVNRPDFQRDLGFKTLLDYKPINFDLNMEWAMDPRISIPTSADLTYLLNGGIFQPRNRVAAESVVPVLVLNGEFDVAW